MEFYKNLLKKDKKSDPQVIIGIIMIIFALIIIISRIYSKDFINSFYWLVGLLFLLQGVVHIIEGKGSSIEKFFGEAFININSAHIRIKVKVLKPEIIIDWKSIQRIEYKTAEIEFQKTDKCATVIKYNILGYNNTKLVKEVIAAIAQKKGIEIQTA